MVSSSGSPESGVGEVLVPLLTPSTVLGKRFLCHDLMYLITLLEKGINGATDVFIDVPIATNEGYNDCCGIFGITCLYEGSSCAASVVWWLSDDMCIGVLVDKGISKLC